MKRILFIIHLFLSHGLNAQYINITNNTFKLNGQDFFPLVLNYIVQIRKNSAGEYWVTPTHCYGNSNEFECQDKASCLLELAAQFQMIKDLGFNTIRLCGLTPDYNSDYPTNITGKIYMTSTLLPLGQPIFNSTEIKEELTPLVRSQLFALINDVLIIASQKGLKVILLTGGPDASLYREKYSEYLQAMAYNFKLNPSILAYDIFNEPTYFSKMISENLTKSQICNIVSTWIYNMKNIDNNHLITIGFSNSSSVGDWDAMAIPVDFASFHPYGNINYVENEIYWYSQHITKPWIIGETGFPGDNLISLYETQKQFANIVSKRCRNCGGDGFSWWQYQDVWWSKYENNLWVEDWFNNNLGILSHQGTTETSIPGVTVQGSLKPISSEFQNFFNYAPTNICNQYSNYYNNTKFNYLKVKGVIVNQNNVPVNGAVVIGSRISGGLIIAQTYSKNDGSFELYSDSQDTIEVIDYNYLSMESGKSYITNLGALPINNLSYGSIEIGQIENYSGKNKIITTNFIIKGNGINGGNVTINAPNNITLGSGTKVLKGGVLKVNNAYVLENSLLLVPFSGCNLQQIDDLNSNLYEENKNIHLQLEIKPNPTNGLIQIRNLEIGILNRIQVTDIFGNVIKEVSTDNEQYTLDLTTQPTAMYFLVISNINNQRFFKIIKE